MIRLQLQEGHCGDCRFLETWNENQSPHGSGRYWPMAMADCTCDDEGEDYPDDGNCPHWKPIDVAVCEKHQREYLADGICPDCEGEAYEQMYRDEHGTEPVYAD